jgi:hypothetical protein
MPVGSHSLRKSIPAMLRIRVGHCVLRLLFYIRSAEHKATHIHIPVHEDFLTLHN